jgi:hypothetical protein
MSERAIATILLLLMLTIGAALAQPRAAYGIGNEHDVSPLGRTAGALGRGIPIGSDLWYCVTQPEVRSPYCT